MTGAYDPIELPGALQVSTPRAVSEEDIARYQTITFNRPFSFFYCCSFGGDGWREGHGQGYGQGPGPFRAVEMIYFILHDQRYLKLTSTQFRSSKVWEIDSRRKWRRRPVFPSFVWNWLSSHVSHARSLGLATSSSLLLLPPSLPQFPPKRRSGSLVGRGSVSCACRLALEVVKDEAGRLILTISTSHSSELFPN